MDLTGPRAALLEARAAAAADLERLDAALAALGAAVPIPAREKATASLRDAIRAVLRDAQQPLPLSQLAAAVRATGFQTRARNFRGNVSGMLTQMLRAKQVKRSPQGYSAR